MEILDAKTDIGLIRDKNEDASLIVCHPKNKNIKLLAVADGMGGKQDGDIASQYIINSLKRWFTNKKIKQLNNYEEIIKLLTTYLKRLNNNLIKKYGPNHLGTTLTIALIIYKYTIFFNCGDSRGYIYQDNKLIQVTADDSEVWFYYKYGEVEKDDLRYFVNNNLINACIGTTTGLCMISTYVIENNYDMLLLFTDGVTDMITDDKISKIIRKEAKENILDKIINEAVYVDQNLFVPTKLQLKSLSKYIIPFNGRDNATGVIYIKENV